LDLQDKNKHKNAELKNKLGYLYSSEIALTGWSSMALLTDKLY